MDYDPLLAKLAVWSDTRVSATNRLRRAISEFRVMGITTNLSLFAQLLADPQWAAAHLHTGFLDDFMQRYAAPEPSDNALAAAVLATAVTASKPTSVAPAQTPRGAWGVEAKRGLVR
jgi:acetyl/propionyl-CoA carboxylase alpha subunit